MKKRKRPASSCNADKQPDELSKAERVELELDDYLSSSFATVSGSSDPLKWWKANSSRFPTLAKLALRYLAMNATSVASERLFSISGHIVNKKRASMKPDTVNRMVFLACNL